MVEKTRVPADDVKNRLPYTHLLVHDQESNTKIFVKAFRKMDRVFKNVNEGDHVEILNTRRVKHMEP